jgi:hypothetical protein
MTNKEHIEAIALKVLIKQPKPQYELFQQTRSGKIVGMCWRGVAHCIMEGGIEPGWMYWIESEETCEHLPVEESRVRLISPNQITEPLTRCDCN